MYDELREAELQNIVLKPQVLKRKEGQRALESTSFAYHLSALPPGQTGGLPIDARAGAIPNTPGPLDQATAVLKVRRPLPLTGCARFTS